MFFPILGLMQSSKATNNRPSVSGEGSACWHVDEGDHPHEAHYLKLDCSKAKSRLDWHPKWHLDEALGRIVDWQKQYQQGADMKLLTLAQISDYQMNKGDTTCKL